MDKGYDSEDIHRLIHEVLDSSSLIPVRDRKRKRIFGYCRRCLARSFDEDTYHQRNMVETVFSVMKRKFGESLKARKFRLQIKEIKFKVILYNISRIIAGLILLIEVFYRALITFPVYQSLNGYSALILYSTCDILAGIALGALIGHFFGWLERRRLNNYA